jgi:hypothetical protein
MDGKPEQGRFSLKRWSDRKLAAARAPADPVPVAPPAPRAGGDAEPPPAQARPAATVAPVQPAADAPLPPVETLTFDADFTAFMQPGVDPTLKRAALKRLFTDPRFNVMDGLDVYIDDYTKPDPIDAETVRGLVQARYLFDPPKTRVNERGDVEEVPPEAVADAGGRAAADEAPALPEAAGPSPGEPAPPAAPVERTESVDPKARP